MQEEIYVTKMDGTREVFDPNKLRHSLQRSGASDQVVERVVSRILTILEDGMTTNLIYKLAFQELEKIERRTAARYSLRRALTDLGPSGFPFEFFVSEVFRSQGYQTKTGQIIQGKCITHEVDVVAMKPKELIVCELKFHNTQRMKSDVKVALYVKARFDDILASPKMRESGIEKIEGRLITNTKFTHNALKYAECVGLDLISWSYPDQGNLHDLIVASGLHPLTCLTTLPDREKRILLKSGTVLCKSLADNPHVLSRLGLKDEKVEEVLLESKMVCTPDNLM